MQSVTFTRLHRSRLARNLVGISCWTYLVIVLAIWIVVRETGERWWVGTLLLFGPRWVLAVPVLGLVPAALLVRRRWLWVVGLAAVIVLVPFMGLSAPWRSWVSGKSNGTRLRVLTCNTHHHAIDLPKLTALIKKTNPDVVVLQEWTLGYLKDVFVGEGWHFLTRNEQCLASRFPIISAEELARGDIIRFTVDLPGGPVQIFNVHLASPHNAFRDALHGAADGAQSMARNSEVRLKEAQLLNQLAGGFGGGTIIAGDLNLPADSPIYRVNLAGLADAFTAAGWGFGYTYHARWTLTRIDYILTGNEWNCTHCQVQDDVGSPHRPLLADLERSGQSK